MLRFFWDVPTRDELTGESCALRLTSENEAPVDPPPMFLPARIESLERRMMLSVAAPAYALGAALPVAEPPVLVASQIGPVSAPTAAVSSVAQLVSLSWTAVSGANAYGVQRSDDGGHTWNSVGSGPLISSDTTASDYDFNQGARLLASTSYQYRLAAYDALGIAHYSDAISGTTSSKHLYDDTFLVGKPDLAPNGLNKSDTTGALETIVVLGGQNEVYLDQNLFDAAAAKAYADHAIFVIDFENLKLTVGNATGQVIGPNPPADPVEQVIRNLRAIVAAIDLARQAVPGVVIGWHANGASTPTEDPTHGDFDAALWSGLNLYQSSAATRDSSYDLFSRLNMVSPENYLWQGQSLSTWRGMLAAETQLWRTTLQLFGHATTPVIPALSPFLYSRENAIPLPAGTWTAMLASASDDPNSDGIRIWAAQQGQFGAESWSGPDHQAWWADTLKIIEEPADPPAAPVFSTASTMIGSLSWTYQAGAADGFVVERSADGLWPDTPVFDSTRQDSAFLVPGGSAATWTDGAAQSGTVYQYRVAAIAAGAFSGWSDPVLATSAVNATAPLSTFPNPVSQWTSTINASNYFNGVIIGGTATLYYSAMDFGHSGVDHVALDIAEWSPGNDYAGGTLQIFIDSDPAAGLPSATVPINDDVHNGPTDIDAIISGAVAPTRGVHAVWLRFVPPPLHPWASAAVRSVQFSAAGSGNVVLANGASGSIYLKLDSDGKTLDAWQNSDPSQAPPTSQYLLADIRSLLIQGAGDTSLIIDASNGNPLPETALDFSGGSGANSLEVIGTPGNDVFLYQGQPLGTSGAWSSAVLFNWHTMNLPNNIAVSYRTNGGTDSIGIRANAIVSLLPNPVSSTGPQPIRISALTLGAAATLIAPFSGASDPSGSISPAPGARSVLVVDSLDIMAAGDLSSVNNPLLLGTLDLRDSDMIVNHLDLFGFDIDPFTNTVSQSTLQQAAISQMPQNFAGWTGKGITSLLMNLQTPSADATFDGIALT